MNFWVILIVELFMCLLLTINDGTLASYLTETFPTDVRYSASPFRLTWHDGTQPPYLPVEEIPEPDNI